MIHGHTKYTGFSIRIEVAGGYYEITGLENLATQRKNQLPATTRLDYQPLFGKGVRAPPPERHERAVEIEPKQLQANEI